MMSGKGRGRGRGKGAQMSFDYSQLGFTGGETLPAPVLQPPPTFPPLEHKALPLKSEPENEYMVALKRDLVEFLHSIRQNNDSSPTIERFSDKYQMMSSDTKDVWETLFNWEYLPAELNPKKKKNLKRKYESDNRIVNAKKRKIDVTKKLSELAKLEDKDENEDEEEEEEEEEEAKDSEEKDGDDENENNDNPEEDEDEEMDDGTDYVNNYFDNGESYFDDEDDNLDDGPVY